MTNAGKLAPLAPRENQSRPAAAADAAAAAGAAPAAAADNGGGGPRVSHNVTKDEKEAAAKQAVGTDSFELVGVADFVSPQQALAFETRKSLYPIERINSTGALAPNRRVAAKGVWIPGSPNRINLTSVVVLDESCGTSTANNQ